MASNSKKLNPIPLTQAYLPPYFEDQERLLKIQTSLPKLDRMYQEHAEKNGYPCYVYGLVFEGQLIHSKAEGYVDMTKKIPVNSHSMFRIASMTKSFTAMTILKLRDEGKLHLDDPIHLYLPEIKTRRLTSDSPFMTLRDLLTHSAGLPTDDPWADRKLEETDEELISLLRETFFCSNPCGITFEYSNLGYTLLGYLIKKVTGIPYQEFIEREFFNPLGLEAYWEYTKVPEPLLVHGYSFKEEEWVKEPLLHDGAFGAMGGMITSLESFARYLAFHQNAWPPRDEEDVGPLKRSSLREMHQPRQFSKLDPQFKYARDPECAFLSAYGYGLRWLRDSVGRIFVGHRGGLPGFGSNWFFLPEYGIGIISLTNRTYADTSKIDLDILNELIVACPLKPRKLPSSHLLKESQKKLLSLIPEWEGLQAGIFANNFFLDRSLESFKSEVKKLVSKMGKLLSISEMTAENQLSGSFVLHGEKSDLSISFGLTPDSCLIQRCDIKEKKR